MDAVRMTLKKTLIFLIYSGIGALLALLVVFVLFVNSKPDLESWHTIALENEFTADMDLQTLDEYRDLEDQLFIEMQERINDKIPGDKKSVTNRFANNSLSNPERWPQNWNRTYELKAEEPSAGILMLHGLSDSPYSLRHLAHSLNDNGAWVVGLRIPGHGTVPSGLVEVRWQDMAAAVRLAMQHLSITLAGKPLYIVGYSNGATLAIHYALTALDQDDIPQPQRLVLLSPAIAVTPMAAFAVWQARLGHLLGLEKLEWQGVLPEYDPFKYQSFAINAGDLSFQFTNEVQSMLARLAADDRLKQFPPTLGFLSAVDSTVSTRAVIENFLKKLSPNQHELIVFDLNRHKPLEHLIKVDPAQEIEKLLTDKNLPFTFGVVRNHNKSDVDVVLSINAPGSTSVATQALGMAWSEDSFSLSHVALPFPPNDSLYGGPDALQSPGVSLGHLTPRGEKGALTIPTDDMLRQRWNPFYPLVERRTGAFLLQAESVAK